MGPTRSNRIENSKRPKSACPRVTSAPSDWSAGSAVLRSISLFAGSIDESQASGRKSCTRGKEAGLWFFPVFTKSPCRHETVPSCRACGDRWGPAMGGWTPALVCASLALFIAAGVCEVGGGWLVWQSLREVRASHSSRPVPTKLFRLTTLSLQGKPWWWGLCGSVVLVVYGFIPCMQPMSDFGRVYAVYGGFFIALSYLWGEHPRRRNPKSKTHPHHPTDSPPPNSSPQGTDWTDSSPTWVTWSGVRCA